jgi:hypothetical protein
MMLTRPPAAADAAACPPAAAPAASAIAAVAAICQRTTARIGLLRRRSMVFARLTALFPNLCAPEKAAKLYRMSH